MGVYTIWLLLVGVTLGICGGIAALAGGYMLHRLMERKR